MEKNKSIVWILKKILQNNKKTWKYSLGSSNSVSGMLKSVSIVSKKIKDKCYHIFHVDELMLTFLS